MKRAKRRFSYEERYAVWNSNGRRCWWCKEPLRIFESTIDHVLPEWLLDDEPARIAVLAEYGLSSEFNINGYENWLPCHTHCNQSKADRLPTFVPGNKLILDKLVRNARKVAEMERSLVANVTKDRVFARLFAALEQRTLSVRDLETLLRMFAEAPSAAGVPDDIIILDSGYWISRDEIVQQGTCRCERPSCIGHENKVYCYFQSSLPPWVVTKGLFWRCYDEVIACPRCSSRHKRGHIGRESVCNRPYRNQGTQSD